MLIQNTGGIAQALQANRMTADRLAENTMPIPNYSRAKDRTTPELTNAELKNTVNSFNDVMKQSSQNLEFSIDSETKKPVIKLVDSGTGEVIRQIPSEEMLAIARSIDHFQQSALLKQKI